MFQTASTNLTGIELEEDLHGLFELFLCEEIECVQVTDVLQLFSFLLFWIVSQILQRKTCDVNSKRSEPAMFTDIVEQSP